jgi:DNA-directed RNA polymerase sigma subunit (sigma70/sigma32)
MNVNLNKTSTQKLKKLRKEIDKIEKITNKDLFIEQFESLLKKEIKNLKGCSEKNIVEFYINELKAMLEKDIDINEQFFKTLEKKTRQVISHHYASQKTFDNNIDIYFNDVKREYIMHPQSESNNLEFLPENRDVFIKNNLKLVINCAKRYRNLGVPFDDLIQAGNLGLCVAFDKFDTNRGKLRKQIIDNIEDFEGDGFSLEDANKVINDSFDYSKDLDVTLGKLPKDGFTTKDDFINWTKKNVKTAVFASVAFQWIRAYILAELSKNGKIIKAPTLDDEEEDDNKKSTINIISLDSINPYTNDCYQDDILSPVTSEAFLVEDTNIENLEKKDMFKKIVSNALYKLSSLDARIIKKRFGIDLPYNLSVNEIAASENMNPNKVKYSISLSLKTIANSISPEDKEIITTLLLG